MYTGNLPINVVEVHEATSDKRTRKTGKSNVQKVAESTADQTVITGVC